MKLLVDAQLPPRLAAWLEHRGHDATHVVSLDNGLRMADTDIWRHARETGSVIITKDRDFLDLATVYGSPPVVLLIALGNASTTTLLASLEIAWPALEMALSSPDAGIVALERERIVVTPRG